jgi:nitroimidazol reductase NimA-like FMN-containing flavoprotein (pyridoxamine 5'-phosphate oxidase superfamily)
MDRLRVVDRHSHRNTGSGPVPGPEVTLTIRADRPWRRIVDRSTSVIMDQPREVDGLVQLDEAECWEFLARRHLGRVGLVHLDQPMIFPVNYALDGHSVVFRTAPGTKLAMAAADRPAVFEVDEASELFETGTSVMLHGALKEITDPVERDRVSRLPIRPWARGRDHFVRIDHRWISGRRIPMPADADGVAADGG